MFFESIETMFKTLKDEGSKIKLKESNNLEKNSNYSNILTNQMEMIKTTSFDKLYELNNSIENNIERIATRNEYLEGKNHPETGVPFVLKIVEDRQGILVEAVVAEFDSVFEVKISKDLCEATDSIQFNECNQQLKKSLESNLDLRKNFSEEQFEQIMDNETPDGFTWHHDAEKGKMQLVNSDIHIKTGHTGGRAIWGGGSENR